MATVRIRGAFSSRSLYLTDLSAAQAGMFLQTVTDAINAGCAITLPFDGKPVTINGRAIYSVGVIEDKLPEIVVPPIGSDEAGETGEATDGPNPDDETDKV